MSITIYEKPTSRECVLSLERGSQITYDVFAIATANENEVQVLAAVEAHTSYYYTGFEFLVLKSISMKPRGGPYWEGAVVFALPEGASQSGDQANNSAAEANDAIEMADVAFLDNSFAFEAGGGTTHIVQSLSTITQVAKVGVGIPPTKQIIGLDKNRIHGVDISDPKFSFTVTRVFGRLTLGYLKTLRYIVGKVNNATFLAHPSGELLLEGASGQYKAGSTSNPLGSWSVSFKFAAQHNRKGIVVGDIPAFNKLGWDYVWFGYQDLLDAGTGLTIPTPVYASVERVYIFTDFAKLGFGPDITKLGVAP